MASQPQRSRSRSRDGSTPTRRDGTPARAADGDLEDLEGWKQTGELPPGYDSREQLERDPRRSVRLNDQRSCRPGIVPAPRPPPPPQTVQRSDGSCARSAAASAGCRAPSKVLMSRTRRIHGTLPSSWLRPPLEADIGTGRPEELCRSEICFDGDVPGGAQFSVWIACLPLNPTKRPLRRGIKYDVKTRAEI